MSAPDFAVGRDSVPATPARTATSAEYSLGWEMKSVAGCPAALSSSGAEPVTRSTVVSRKLARMASGKPPRARRARARRARPAATSATHNPPAARTPARRPGPDDEDQSESSMMSTVSDERRGTMNAAKLNERSPRSRTSEPRPLPRRRRLPAEPTAACSARRAESEMSEMTGSIAIEHLRLEAEPAQFLHDEVVALARDIAENDRLAGGCSEASGSRTMFNADGLGGAECPLRPVARRRKRREARRWTVHMPEDPRDVGSPSSDHALEPGPRPRRRRREHRLERCWEQSLSSRRPTETSAPRSTTRSA